MYNIIAPTATERYEIINWLWRRGIGHAWKEAWIHDDVLTQVFQGWRISVKFKHDADKICFFLVFGEYKMWYEEGEVPKYV